MSEEQKPPNTTGPDSEKSGKSGNLLQRITGSLRRVTGSIDTTPTPPESQPPSPQPPVPERAEMKEDLFEDLRASLPRETELESEQPPAVPSEDLRRMTDELDFARLVPGFERSNRLPEEEVPPQETRQETELGTGQPDFGSVRGPERPGSGMTSPFRRVTGPLNDTDALKPSSEEIGVPPARDIEPTIRDTGELPPPGSENMRAGMDLSPTENEQRAVVEKEKESPGLIRRITGSLRRVTGSLGTSPLRSAQRRETGEAGQGEEPGAPADKPKRDTGPLGSLLSNILRSQEGERKEAARRRPPEGPDFVSEIRQDLASDELQQQIKPKRTTNFLQRITGNLRRVTGSLGHTGQIFDREPEQIIPRPEPSPEPPVEIPLAEIREEEIEADLLKADQLAAPSVPLPPGWTEPEDIVIELEPEQPEPFAPVSPEPETFTFDELETQLSKREEPSELEPIDLLDSGVIAALDKAEEKRSTEIEPDWMSEIRQEAAEQEAAKEPGEGEDRRKGVSSPLRDFLTGIFRTEEKPPVPSEPELPDELVTGRLGQSLGIEPAAPAEPLEAAGEGAEPVSAEPAPTAQFTVPDETDFTFDEDATFLSRFQSGFGQAAGDEIAEDQATFIPLSEEQQDEELKEFVPFQPIQPPDDREVFTISPEDEKLLWGTPPEEQAAEDRTLRPSTWETEGAETLPQMPPPMSDDAYAATFLTGSEVAPAPTESQARPRRVTGRLTRERVHKPFEDIRSALLDETQVGDRPRTVQPAETHRLGAAEVGKALAPGEVVYEHEHPRPARPGLRAWLATRTVLQKIILVEIILVILALMLVIPLFLIRFFGAQTPGAAIPATLPRALPADVPYPTGVTLPGGWSFQLAKSTFVDSKWSPRQSEWLEGTELRRVIALPWNPQTEAVVQTFQPGDPVSLTLSNADLVQYRVDRVERVNVEDVSIYTDVRPSLAIILFKEDAQERWVVFCKR